MKKTIIEIISLFLTVVSCFIQWFPLPPWLFIMAIVLLILSSGVLLFLIIDDLINIIRLKYGLKKKKRIKKANDFIYNNSSPKFVLYGGNLSWVKDYKDALEQKITQGSRVEIYYDNTINYNSHAKELLKGEIGILKEIGCCVFELDKVYGLRCILCFSQDNLSISKIYEVKKIKETKKNKKNKYLVAIIEQNQSYHMIQIYTAVYNMTINNLEGMTDEG